MQNRELRESARPLPPSPTSKRRTCSAIRAASRLFVQLFQAIDAGDVAKLQAAFSSDAKFSMSGVPVTMDFDGFMQAAGGFLTAFGQARLVIKSQLAEGDRVSTHIEWQAVHIGAFHGIPASNKPVKIQAISNHRVSNGKITEHIAMFDVMTLMQQVGAMQAAALHFCGHYKEAQE